MPGDTGPSLSGLRLTQVFGSCSSGRGSAASTRPANSDTVNSARPRKRIMDVPPPLSRKRVNKRTPFSPHRAHRHAERGAPVGRLVGDQPQRADAVLAFLEIDEPHHRPLDNAIAVLVAERVLHPH